MQALVSKFLTSRKFWLAVGAAVPYAVAGDWVMFSNILLGLGGIQGGIDVATAIGKPAGVDHKDRGPSHASSR